MIIMVKACCRMRSGLRLVTAEKVYPGSMRRETIMERVQMRRSIRLAALGFAGVLAVLLATFTWSSLANSASLSASPTEPRQNDTVTLVGSGFLPFETVSVWITYPDFRVYGVAEVATDATGAFSFPYLPDFLGATFTPTGRYTYTAYGWLSGREVYADINVAIGQAPGVSTGVSLTAAPGVDAQGSYFAFSGSGYAANEEVAVWLRYPDNSVSDLGRTWAASDGTLYYILYVSGAPVGNYALTARGLFSSANGIAEFTVQVSDLTVATGVAQLTVGPSPDTQRSLATFSGSGFQPGEVVTVWVTLPDYSTLWIGDISADGAGVFTAVLYLSEQEPVGFRTYTAYGNTSGRRATADYTLEPGGGNPALNADQVDAVIE
jgi:hypothetical protein